MTNNPGNTDGGVLLRPPDEQSAADCCPDVVTDRIVACGLAGVALLGAGLAGIGDIMGRPMSQGLLMLTISASSALAGFLSRAMKATK